MSVLATVGSFLGVGPLAAAVVCAVGGLGGAVIIVGLIQRLVSGVVRMARSLMRTAAIGTGSAAAVLPSGLTEAGSWWDGFWSMIAGVVPLGGAGVLAALAVVQMLRHRTRWLSRTLVYGGGAVTVIALLAAVAPGVLPEGVLSTYQSVAPWV